MPPSPPFVTPLVIAYVALVLNLAAFALNLRSYLWWRRKRKRMEPAGRCPVCERMKRDHSVSDLEQCLARARDEAAQDGRIVIPVHCRTCNVDGAIAMSSACGVCGKPFVMGGAMADVP